MLQFPVPSKKYDEPGLGTPDKSKVIAGVSVGLTVVNDKAEKALELLTFVTVPAPAGVAQALSPLKYVVALGVPVADNAAPTVASPFTVTAVVVINGLTEPATVSIPILLIVTLPVVALISIPGPAASESTLGIASPILDIVLCLVLFSSATSDITTKSAEVGEDFFWICIYYCHFFICL